MPENTQLKSRIKLAPELVEKLRNSEPDIQQLEFEVRNMERANLPGAAKQREKVNKLREDIDSILVVYG